FIVTVIASFSALTTPDPCPPHASLVTVMSVPPVAGIPTPPDGRRARTRPAAHRPGSCNPAPGIATHPPPEPALHRHRRRRPGLRRPTDPPADPAPANPRRPDH